MDTIWFLIHFHDKKVRAIADIYMFKHVIKKCIKKDGKVKEVHAFKIYIPCTYHILK